MVCVEVNKANEFTSKRRPNYILLIFNGEMKIPTNSPFTFYL